MEFLDGLVNDPVCSPDKAEHAPLVAGLARAVAYEGKVLRLEKLLALAGARSLGDWQRLAILDGLAGTLPAPVKGGPALAVRPVVFAAEPAGWIALRAQESPAVRERVQRLNSWVAWPGHNDAAATAATKLTEVEQDSFDRGKELYATVCFACHQPHGDGQEGLAPPLRESEWTVGSPARLVRIVLHGARDAFTVKGQKWELAMPAFSEALDDQQIADVLTYVRREWGHTAAPVTTNLVATIRAAEAKRDDAWTEGELLKIP